jgi:hypothetical protein
LNRRFAFFLLMIPLLGYGQESSVLSDLEATSPQTTLLAKSRIDGFIQNLKSSYSSSDIALLKRVFHRTQKEFLRQYTSYADFSEIFDSGRYDCLTATSLFSVVLSELNVEYTIVETNYHIFLLVNTSKGEVLLETTDRFNGFVRNEKEISQRIGRYRQGLTAAADTQNSYRYHCDLYREVNPGQLPGLLYYNQAVKAYNAGRLGPCGELLLKAKFIYDTPRINEFVSIFLKAVVESTMDDQAKLRIIRQFKGVMPALASL